ncbi:MAG: sensor histidine kinase [Polaribacter sp.]|uniref:tetratricopeptide repeat-containing sensor histidine kinase n=1 Tax=Polaribacter sp. TaxID=1920175 RepID=UPI003266D5A8
MLNFVLKKLFFSIIIISTTISLFSQQKQIDALKEKLKGKNINDSIRIKYLGDLGWYYSGFAADSAFKYSKLGLNLSIKTNNLNGIAQGFNDIGIIYYRISQFDSSLVFYKKSLKIRKRIKDSLGIASIYNKLGIAHNQLFHLDSAIYCALESIKIYKKFGRQKLVAMNLNNVANLYKDSKQYLKAFKTHKECLKIRMQLKDSIGYVYSFNGIADLYGILEKKDSSEIYYKKALPIAKKLNLRNELSVIYNNLGTLYKNQGKQNSALNLFNKSLKLRKEINDNYGIISSYINLSLINIEKKKFKIAEKQLLDALSKTKKINTTEQLIYIYKGLISVKGNLNEPDSLDFYFKKYEQINDSLYNKQIVEQIADIDTKYKTAEKEKEISIQKEQLLSQELSIKNKSLYALLFGASFIILAIISVGVFRKNQFKRKQLQKEIDLKDALSTIKTQNRLQEQRLRISRDLHDNIGSQLTFIISSVDNLKYISKDANQKLKDKLSNISSFTSQTIDELRDTIWAMNKTEISVEDLHARILSFIEKAKIATEKTTFKITENIDKNANFSSLVGMNIFRVIQEAINNAIKYANASKIEINLIKKDNNFDAIVKDNGTGFNIKTVDLGNGLSNMEKRMSEINGSVNINSQLEKGTKISISISLKNTTNDV